MWAPDDEDTPRPVFSAIGLGMVCCSLGGGDTPRDQLRPCGPTPTHCSPQFDVLNNATSYGFTTVVAQVQVCATQYKAVTAPSTPRTYTIYHLPAASLPS